MPSRYSLKSRRLRKLEQEIDRADSYEQWLELAEQHDDESGANLWRQQEDSPLYDNVSIKTRLQNLRRLRRKKDDHGLLFALNEGIHGNIGGMGRTKLWRRAKSGTKHLVEEYVNEIRDALEYLSPRRFKGIPWAERIEFYQRASHCYGRSALMLSGGGTLGYFHLGVVKVLIEQGLCPVVISGASAGSFVAAVVGTHSDREYLKLFENDMIAKALTESNDKVKIGFGKQEDIDMRAIKAGIARLVPDMTFLEAYEKTGRSINISISPAEPHQTSRLLNHIASPNVTIRSAVLASTALPGVFSPVQLEARNVDNDIKAYLPSRRWIDGSFSQDLPAKRLARMYGVNHFIVSQVMPFLGKEPRTRPGIYKIVGDASLAATKQIVRGSLDFIQRYASVGPRMGAAMNAVNALLDQRFTGDINIFPGHGVFGLGRLLKMLTEKEMAALIKAGERATWSKVPMIRTTTRIGRTLDRILLAFEADEVHWLQSGPRTDVVRKKDTAKNPRRRKPVSAGKSRKRISAAGRTKAKPVGRTGVARPGTA